MKLKIMYDNKVQELELDAEATEALRLSLSIEIGKDVDKEERENLIQMKFDEMFNKPEYSNWRRHKTHKADMFSYFTHADDEGEYEERLIMENVADDRVFFKQKLEIEAKEDYEAVCQKIRLILSRKPEWADIFIAVRINGMRIAEYAELVGDDENNVSHKFARAEKAIRKLWGK